MIFFGLIAAAVSAIGTFVSSVVTTVGPVISGVAKSIALIVSEIPPAKVFQTLETICAIVEGTSDVLGLIEPGETTEILGAKASQPDVRPFEEFDSAEEYIRYLRAEVELDTRRFDRMSLEEKQGCTLVGSSILIKGVEEIMGVQISPSFLIDAAKINLKYTEVKAYMDSFVKHDLKDMQLMTDYLSGKGSWDTVDTVDLAVTQGIQSLYPKMPEQEVQEKLIQMKQDARKDF